MFVEAEALSIARPNTSPVLGGYFLNSSLNTIGIIELLLVSLNGFLFSMLK